MAGIGVRREKAALSSGCKAHPAISLQSGGASLVGAGYRYVRDLPPLRHISTLRIRDSHQIRHRVPLAALLAQPHP